MQSHKGVESIMREIQRVSGTSHMATPPGAAPKAAGNGWGPAQPHGQDIAGPSFLGSEDEVMLRLQPCCSVTWVRFQVLAYPLAAIVGVAFQHSMVQ